MLVYTHDCARVSYYWYDFVWVWVRDLYACVHFVSCVHAVCLIVFGVWSVLRARVFLFFFFLGENIIRAFLSCRSVLFFSFLVVA